MRLVIGGLTLIVIGFVLCVVASNIAHGETPALDVILRDGLNALFTSVPKTLTGPSMSDRAQGIGSAFAYLGVIIIVVWVIQRLLPRR
jgi:hypothetical protein